MQRAQRKALGCLPVVELDVRMTMGRVAMELLDKSRPGSRGRLRILRKSKLTDEEIETLRDGSLEKGSVILNDPRQAKEFLVVWEVSRA